MEPEQKKRWVDDVFCWDLIKAQFLYKAIPGEIGWMYTLGSLCLFLFTLQVATGVILAASYAPTLEGAHVSDRPAAANGKVHVWWGTLRTCPACGHCLCFGCHPKGPCVDERLVAWPAAGVVPARAIERTAS